MVRKIRAVFCPMLSPWVGLVAIIFTLSGCFGPGYTGSEPVVCAEKRLSLAAAAYDEAKGHYLEHMRTRGDSDLFFAFHAAEDAIRVARSVKFCDDFSQKTKDRAIDVIRSNRLLQQLVVMTMRDSDPGVTVGLLPDKYREVFKNDIH